MVVSGGSDDISLWRYETNNKNLIIETIGMSKKLQLTSPESLLQILQRCFHTTHSYRVKQIHALLTTQGHLLITTQWINTLLYNTLIRAYLNLSKPRATLLLFVHMLRHDAPPNSHTLPSLLKAAASSLPRPSYVLGYSLNAQGVRRGLLNDPFVRTSFLSLYSHMGDMWSARKMFDEIPRPCVVSYNAMVDAFAKTGALESAVSMFAIMPERDVYSWTSIINGYVRNGCFREAVKSFRDMMVDVDVINGSMRPNEATFVTVLSSCANLDDGFALHQGKQIHGYMFRSDKELSVYIGTALIAFYGKLASLNYAYKVFNSMAVKEVCTWNAMICSLASNGREKQALDMFDMMKARALCPNEVTFVGVLSACARTKHVDLGLELFHSMLSDFHIKPRMEHYGCMVDLLGRAGLLKEAFEFVKSMPIEADASVLGALLGACRVHGAVELGEEVGRRLLELQPHHCGRYVLLSSIYAGAEIWDHAAALRRAMVSAGIQKVPAFSLA